MNKLKSLLKALKGKSPEYIAATFTSVAQNKLSHEFLLTFFIDNWGIISERLKDYKGNLRSVIVSCLRTIRSDVQIMMMGATSIKTGFVFVESLGK
ncbi:hypothetical protein OESDEN_05754 [Oesophagostomum dentatum]|uniref:Uncharacterized protein n=1 Tax=Oesophagostomum dentatum TaxID=61180 RepID=A0A0B1TDX4_OESDE|nr:hypothetical protein OESDEN_05754 [Oesophagostomum dentatum]